MSQVATPPQKRERVGEFRRADFSFEIRADATQLSERRFGGYASVFNVPIPSYQEVVDPGAFDRTLADRGDRVKVLWQHDSDRPIGLPTLMREDPIGLYVEAQLADTASVRDEYMPLLIAKVVDRMSIGFRIVDYIDCMDSADGLYHLTDVELYEFSPVTFPANEAAIINDVRSQALGKAKQMMGLADERKPLSSEDAKYAMALLMGARGAGSFADLPADERRGLYERLSAEYERHGMTPPEVADFGIPAYTKIKFVHGEQSTYAARSLRKSLVNVTSAAQHAARLGVPIDSVFVAEAQAALDAIEALGLGGVQGRMDRLAQVRDLTKRLGITQS
jgi:HK97 family phage prohead protease